MPLQVMPHAAFLDLLHLSKESVLAEPLTMEQVRYSRHISVIYMCILLYLDLSMFFKACVQAHFFWGGSFGAKIQIWG